MKRASKSPKKFEFVSAAVLSAVAAASLAPRDASAAGLYFADRGVRPAARAGAFVAGADDLGAIAYNPAGLYDAGSAFLFDASYLHFTSDYQRESIVRQIDPNTGKTLNTFEKTFPSVSGSSPVLPIPTIAYSFQPHKQWVIALGAWAPYAAITSYPETVGKAPAPQRYSLLTLDGSALAFVGAAAAFAPVKELRLGIGVGALVGMFKSTVDFSGCIPERFFCASEDPRWDVKGQLTVGPIVAPSGEGGVIWIPHPSWHLGASAQLPVYVRSPATIETRLAEAPVFQKAKQVGDDASVAFDLPWNVRVGVENRSVENLRVEVGGGFERWSMHDSITVTPEHVALEDIAGFPKQYFVPPIKFPRDFQDSASARVGGEYTFTAGGHKWDARGGVAYETSAVPKDYLSVLTIDSNKVTTSLGLGFHVNKWRFDLLYAHVFAFTQTVDPHDAKIQQIVPVAANPPKNPDYVNGGIYSARADVIGLGLNYQFSEAPAEFTPSRK